MCGIIHVKSNRGRNVANNVWQAYMDQRSRGSEGFGFISIDKNGVAYVARAEKEKDIKKLLWKTDSTEILFHHRYPTSTPNYINATHPIKVSHKSFKFDYYLVHNGVLYNDDALKREHEKLGFVYNTSIVTKTLAGGKIIDRQEVFNDSEALAVEVALYLEGQKFQIDAMGSIAIMCYQINKKTGKVTKLFYGRNSGNPLIVKRSGKIVKISSESRNGVCLPTNELYTIDYKTGAVKTESVEIGEVYQYPRTGYHANYEVGEDDFESEYKGGIRDDDKWNDFDDDFEYEDTQGLTDEEFEDFLDLNERLQELNREIKEAQRLSDFDTETLLEYERQIILNDMKALKE